MQLNIYLLWVPSARHVSGLHAHLQECVCCWRWRQQHTHSSGPTPYQAKTNVCKTFNILSSHLIPYHSHLLPTRPQNTYSCTSMDYNIYLSQYSPPPPDFSQNPNPPHPTHPPNLLNTHMHSTQTHLLHTPMMSYPLSIPYIYSIVWLLSTFIYTCLQHTICYICKKL